MRSILLCLMLIMTSCNSDDDSLNVNLNGSWTMSNISGGFLGIDTNFEPGQIIWTFDAERQILIVDNSLEEDTTVIISGFVSGNYEYYTTTEEETDFLYVENSKFGMYYINSNNLVIDQNTGSDGFLFTLEYYSSEN
ncbi:MAG TPA: hypothetical protein VKX30_08030 [Flavobacteriaceae bacterium]|nr:hypothetical protein [Flavobacteriaceae bacterium]